MCAACKSGVCGCACGKVGNEKLSDDLRNPRPNEDPNEEREDGERKGEGICALNEGGKSDALEDAAVLVPCEGSPESVCTERLPTAGVRRRFVPCVLCSARNGDASGGWRGVLGVSGNDAASAAEAEVEESKEEAPEEEEVEEASVRWLNTPDVCSSYPVFAVPTVVPESS